MYHMGAVGLVGGTGALLTVTGVFNRLAALVFCAALIFVIGAVRAVTPRIQKGKKA
jgi:hypothetical protein